MDDLRLILLFAGIAVIAGIYAWGRLQGRVRMPRRRVAPSLSETSEPSPDDAVVERELERMQQAISDDAPAAPVAPGDDIEELQVISVVSVSGEPFRGEALARAFANNKLSFGDKSIFYRHVRQSGQDVPVFGVANLFKPGHFGDGELDAFETRGITLFLELPAPIDGLQAFDDFVQTAERLAVELGGQLQDSHHCVITHQALMQKREMLVRSRLRVPLPA